MHRALLLTQGRRIRGLWLVLFVAAGTAHAQGGQPLLRPAPLHLMQKRRQDAGARGADGMADRDCATIGIDLFRINFW